MELFWRYSTESQLWKESKEYTVAENTDELLPYIEINKHIYYQTLDENPWGGCFSDRGWMAMRKLTEEERIKIVKSFYGVDGLRFTAARLPMGNNDFSDTHKSYDEHEDDYNMEYFSLRSDEKYLIPYIKTALNINPDIKFFATPWSPPSWMKYNHNIHGIGEDNRIIFEPDILRSYAKYFARYIKEYERQGIRVDAVTPQNEPTMNTEYASCIWTGGQLNIFIRDYLYPEIHREGIDVQIWLGTFTDSDASLVIPALEDEKTAEMVSGVCFQWWGAPLATAIRKGYGKRLIQSETKCGDGKNNWKYAEEQFDCFKEFFEAGVQSYYIRNMVLDEKGANTAENPWYQNAPVTVDSRTDEVTYTPFYYLIKHFSHYIKPHAKRVRLEGLYSDALAFENPEGEILVLMKNGDKTDKKLSLILDNERANLILKPHSINTVIVN